MEMKEETIGTQNKMTDLTVRKYLEACVAVKPQNIILDKLIENSDTFPIKFPIDTIRSAYLIGDKDIEPIVLERFARSAYPLLHEAVLPLCINFLEYKKRYGSSQEKEIYVNMGIVELVDRLLQKRAVSFTGPHDSYLLIDGRSGHGQWDEIGKECSGSIFSLRDSLSYDEMKLSALLSVSSHSFFINDGNRNNMGTPAVNMSNMQRTGIVVGLVGSRFERQGKMEWEEVMVTEEQNIEINGYGPYSTAKMPEYYWRQTWCTMYELGPHLPLYREVERCLRRNFEHRYATFGTHFFDNTAYANRMAVTIETLILESQHRAHISQQHAYIHVVGVGMGRWMISQHQERIFLDAFGYALRRLLPLLQHITDVNFAWFRENSCSGISDGGYFRSIHPPRSIQIHFSRRNPHDKLYEPHQNKLLIVSYTWDSNALPGNEFWMGSLAYSGGAAQACSSQIAELHNPHINNTKICGNNLHVATTRWGVTHVAQYARWKLNSS